MLPALQIGGRVGLSADKFRHGKFRIGPFWSFIFTMRNTIIFTISIWLLLIGTLAFFITKKEAETPWDDRPSIYLHIKQNLDSSGELRAEGETLPDDELMYEENDIRWAEGGKDGVLGAAEATDSNEETAKNAAELIDAVSRRNKLADKVALYNLLTENSTLDFVDLALDKIVELESPIEPYLHKFIRRLVAESPDREPVKFGIALLGRIKDEADLELITLLGKHEEFTLYSAVAVINILEEPDSVLWEMAKAVDGWGRIQVVERLANTDNPEIKNWLISEGYKNSIMYEYLAYTCAVAGDLDIVLSRPTVSADMLESAGDIINALIIGGPAEDIDDYEHAANVVSDYLRHLEHNAATLKQFIIVHDILEFLTVSDEEWASKEKGGWEKHDRFALAKTAERIANNPEWKKLVLENLDTDDEALFWYVKGSAEILNIDIWDAHWKRLNEATLDRGRWCNVMAAATSSKIDEVLILANQVLPLNEIASGPTEELGLGKEYKAHSTLNCILQELGRFPGKGIELIKAGLQSPAIINRYRSLYALSEWGQEKWPDVMVDFLKKIKAAEPDDNVRESIEKLLKGETLE